MRYGETTTVGNDRHERRKKEMEIRVERTTNPKEKPDMSKVSFGSVFTDHMFLMDHDLEKGWHNGRPEH